MAQIVWQGMHFVLINYAAGANMGKGFIHGFLGLFSDFTKYENKRHPRYFINRW